MKPVLVTISNIVIIYKSEHAHYIYSVRSKLHFWNVLFVKFKNFEISAKMQR